MKILEAMPSQDSFSLQLFMQAWNNSNKRPRIDPGFADIISLGEGLLTNLQVKQYANRPPVFTQFLASFKCNRCGKDHQRVKTWDDQLQVAIPLLQLPPSSNQAVNVMQLLQAHIDEPLQTRCGNLGCKSRIDDARMEIELGFFTVLTVDRFQFGVNPVKLMNRLLVDIDDQQSFNLGELVSVVCHRGDVNHGHFVSYHLVGQQWYLNDDSRRCIPVANPLEQTNSVNNETVDMLFFKR